MPGVNNKENQFQPRKNALNFSAEKNNYTNIFNPLSKLRSSSNNHSKLKVQNYLYVNKSNNNSNNSNGEINIYNNMNIISLNQVINDSKDELIKFVIEEEILCKHLNISEIWLDLHNVLN